MILLDNQKSFELYRQILFRKSERRLVRSFRLLSIKTALDLITKDFIKVDKGIEDFIVSIDQDSTSSLIIHISKLKLPRITKVFQSIILLIHQLFIEALIEIGIIVATLDPTTLPAIILIEIVILNSFYIAIQINIPNFKSLFRIEFTTRIVTEDSALNLREKELKRLYFTEIPLRFNRLFKNKRNIV